MITILYYDAETGVITGSDYGPPGLIVAKLGRPSLTLAGRLAGRPQDWLVKEGALVKTS